MEQPPHEVAEREELVHDDGFQGEGAGMVGEWAGMLGEGACLVGEGAGLVEEVAGFCLQQSANSWEIG